MLKVAFKLGKIPPKYPESATDDSANFVLNPPSVRSKRSDAVKKHNILIEPWRDEPKPGDLLGAPGYRWTVSYDQGGRFFAQGFEDSHGSARAAAEAFLREKGIDLHWQQAEGTNVRVLKPRTPIATVSAAQ